MEKTMYIRHEISAFAFVVAFAVTLIAGAFFHASSKIEQGTVVQKNDSIITIVIPDKLH